TGARYAAQPTPSPAHSGTGPPFSPNQSTQARKTPSATSASPTSSKWCGLVADPRAARRRRRFFTRDGVFGRGLAVRFLCAIAATSRPAPGLLPVESTAARGRQDRSLSADVARSRVGIVSRRPAVVMLPGGVLPAEPAYAALLAELGDSVDAFAKDLEVYRGEAPPAG